MKKTWLRTLFLILLIGTCVGFVKLTTPQTEHDKGADSDGRHYMVMAGDTTFDAVEGKLAPFCYRVATPWIVSKIPSQSYMSGFRTLAVIDAALMLLLMFGWLRAMDFPYWSSVIGMLFFGGVFWTLKFTIFSPAYIDHMTLVIMLLLYYVMAKGWWYLLAPLVFVGLFQKESIMACVPTLMLYYLHQKGWKWIPLYLLGLLLLIASIVPILILRSNIQPANISSPMIAISDSWKFVWSTPGYSRVLIVAILSGLGIMPLILFSRFRWALGYLKQHPEAMGMILIGIFLLFGGKDKARLFVYMLPMVTLVTVAIIQDLQRRLPAWSFRAWLAICLLLHLHLGALLFGFKDFKQYLDLQVPEHSPKLGLEGLSRAIVVIVAFLIINFIFVQRSISSKTAIDGA